MSKHLQKEVRRSVHNELAQKISCHVWNTAWKNTERTLTSPTLEMPDVEAQLIKDMEKVKCQNLPSR